MLRTCSRTSANCWRIAVLGTVVLFAGCSSPLGDVELGQVSGKVTLDGKPLADASVNFTPEDKKAKGSTAITDAEGNYTLRYISGYDGAAVGTHKVEIRKVETVALPGGGAEPATTERQIVAEKYNSQTTLSADVKAGSNTFDFEVESVPAGAAKSPR